MIPFYSISDPLGEIWQGDCRDIIAANDLTWRNGFDFIFADPPFNIQHGYDVCEDNLTEQQLYAFTMEWLGACIYCLREGGVLVIHIPDDMVWMPLVTLHKVEMRRIDWIIWHYRFAVNQSLDTANGFLSSKCHALVFRKGGSAHTFNAKEIAVDSDRVAYGDKRINETANGGKRVPLDVWDEFPRIQGNNGEKVNGHPNQLPEKYLERFIRAYTNPGDYCFDPFGGTGTTAVVARALGRNVATCELSESYCWDIRARLVGGAKRVSPIH